jgi:serine protease AprX
MPSCPLCNTSTPANILAEAAASLPTQSPEVVERLTSKNPNWKRADGACPACVQQALLETLLSGGDEALHESIQSVWPLDAEAAFKALPTPLRLHADPRFTGQGVTLALVDAAFYPHPDLVQPANRIRAWADASCGPVHVRQFEANETPTWPGWDLGHPAQWHGLMTSTVAAGNGWLSHGLYRGLASEANLVLIQVRERDGAITNRGIARALNWLRQNAAGLGVKIVSLSVGGDPEWPNAVDEAIAALVGDGLTVLAAAGNDGQRRLVPPASAPEALTIGGLDDGNTFDHDAQMIWHSNYGAAAGGFPKPELVAPSMWVVAPILPDSGLATEARYLFSRRAVGDEGIESRLSELKLITPHYQHVDGTSFAAPIVASAIACMLEANPGLTPRLIRETLIAAAQSVPGASRERQGAGALEAGRATALALREQHSKLTPYSPSVTASGIKFTLHDHNARQVQVFGSWNEWRSPLAASELESGVWQAERPPLAVGRYSYKFLLDNERWLPDPINPRKAHDGYGGLNSVLIV